ncbi:hypothetical protein LguiB_027050 [Lonicera macranthoides]
MDREWVADWIVTLQEMRDQNKRTKLFFPFSSHGRRRGEDKVEKERSQASRVARVFRRRLYRVSWRGSDEAAKFGGPADDDIHRPPVIGKAPRIII